MIRCCFLVPIHCSVLLRCQCYTVTNVLLLAMQGSGMSAEICGLRITWRSFLGNLREAMRLALNVPRVIVDFEDLARLNLNYLNWYRTIEQKIPVGLQNLAACLSSGFLLLRFRIHFLLRFYTKSYSHSPTGYGAHQWLFFSCFFGYKCTSLQDLSCLSNSHRSAGGTLLPYLSFQDYHGCKFYSPDYISFLFWQQCWHLLCISALSYNSSKPA